MSRSYWPLEGDPEFVADDPDGPWRPLCPECGSAMHFPASHVQTWECTGDFRHPGLILFAEDWPDYDDEEDQRLIRKYDTN